MYVIIVHASTCKSINMVAPARIAIMMTTPYQHVERTLVDEEGRTMLLFYTGMSMFSNFYNSPIHIGTTRTYRTAEHFYQTWKAAYFDDKERWDMIMAEPRPGKAKHLARTIKNFDKGAWQIVAPQIMESVLMKKFQQNLEARRKLLDTGDALIVEASEFDPFWGSGLNIMDDSHSDITKWRGANVLGQILMKVRERLRE